MKGFIDFIRAQGVIGLAVGFILGGAVSKLVASLVADIINPVIGVALGSVSDLKGMGLQLGPVKIMLGSFISTGIDFVVVAATVYFLVKGLGLDKLDQKKA
jgi:large conductance mechanosensitive channel